MLNVYWPKCYWSEQMGCAWFHLKLTHRRPTRYIFVLKRLQLFNLAINLKTEKGNPEVSLKYLFCSFLNSYNKFYKINKVWRYIKKMTSAYSNMIDLLHFQSLSNPTNTWKLLSKTLCSPSWGHSLKIISI